MYATGKRYDELKNELKLPCVDESTPHEDLCHMDVKKDGLYPIYLLDDDYSIRGLNFRAANNPHGICMIICSGFRDSRTRVQAMKRICRYSDKGMYIQAQGLLDIDRGEQLVHLSKVHDAIKEITKRQKKSNTNKRAKMSATEQEEKRENFG